MLAVDLTDENWETVLATNTENPFATPLGPDDVWVVTIYGPDPSVSAFSPPFSVVELTLWTLQRVQGLP